jgi:hypothetical protein
MRIERRIGNKTVYLDFLNGREIRATTAGGPAAAEKIFAIIRAQNGIARGPAVTQDLTATRHHR